MSENRRINGIQILSQFKYRGKILKPFSDKQNVYIPMLIHESMEPVYYKIPKEIFKDE